MGRTLVLSDWDDTLYKTDEFVDEVLRILEEQGLEQLANEIKGEIQQQRDLNGTSAGYDLVHKLQDHCDMLMEKLALTNSERIFDDAGRFYNKITEMPNVDFRVWTRGQELLQQLKLTGTPFAEKVEIFSDKDKTTRFIDKITIKNSNFLFEGIWYSRLIMIDNDAKYLEDFYRLRDAGVRAQGFLVHHNNERFIDGFVEEGVEKMASFDEIDPKLLVEDQTA
ncbi:hypothetical protein FWC31_03110 [Candidatus Saccharibacteria bacterium]|nr:hypothetical protein [Candidatus Saccharibacteria bacterium]